MEEDLSSQEGDPTDRGAPVGDGAILLSKNPFSNMMFRYGANEGIAPQLQLLL